MGKKQEKDLRLVEGVVSAQLAERDAEIANLEKWRSALIKQTSEQIAEIAALKAELAEWQVKSGMYEHSFDEALKDVSYMEADIKALRAQVAELEAWKAAVPVDAIVDILWSAEARTGGNDDTHKVANWIEAINYVGKD